MLLTVDQFSEKYPAFPLRYLRGLLSERKTNGLAEAIIAMSQRRLLIDEERFFQWVETHREGSNE